MAPPSTKKRFPACYCGIHTHSKHGIPCSRMKRACVAVVLSISRLRRFQGRRWPRNACHWAGVPRPWLAMTVRRTWEWLLLSGLAIRIDFSQTEQIFTGRSRRRALYKKGAKTLRSARTVRKSHYAIYAPYEWIEEPRSRNKLQKPKNVRCGGVVRRWHLDLAVERIEVVRSDCPLFFLTF